MFFVSMKALKIYDGNENKFWKKVSALSFSDSLLNSIGFIILTLEDLGLQFHLPQNGKLSKF